MDASPIPVFVAPVMRFLAVAELERSLAFYRDVLGFDVSGGEAVSGPVRLRLEREPPPCTSVVHLQTTQIAARRAAIVAAGGLASAIERVNWIKMQVFEVRDPDGNVLWFGESYHEAGHAEQPRGLQQALPELPFDNVPAAIEWYCNTLGFRINYAQADLGVMDRDAITILLIQRTKLHTGIGSFEVYVEDADALYAEFMAKGANVGAAPVSQPWGLRTFELFDLEGNRITFAQPFE